MRPKQKVSPALAESTVIFLPLRKKGGRQPNGTQKGRGVKEYGLTDLFSDIIYILSGATPIVYL